MPETILFGYLAQFSHGLWSNEIFRGYILVTVVYFLNKPHELKRVFEFTCIRCTFQTLFSKGLRYFSLKIITVISVYHPISTSNMADSIYTQVSKYL